MKKFRNKLCSNRKYYFADPTQLQITLNDWMEEETAKTFLFSLSRFVNTKGQKGISSYSVFIGQLIKNIYALNDKNFKDAQILVDSIKSYTSKITA